MLLHAKSKIENSTLKTNELEVKEGTRNNQRNKKEQTMAKVFHHKTTGQKPFDIYIRFPKVYLSTLFLLTIFLRVAACQIHEIDFKLDKTKFNETNEETTMSWLQIMEKDIKIQNSSDEYNDLEETTHSWQEFTDLDVNDSIQNFFDGNGEAEETTMSWMQMMDLDVKEPVQRLRREVHDVGSGSGSGSTTEEATTAYISTTFVETTTESEGSGITEAPSTTKPVTEVPTTTESVFTEETTEEFTTGVADTTIVAVTTNSEGSGMVDVTTTSETTGFVSSEEVTTRFLSTFEPTNQETSSITTTRATTENEGSGEDETTTTFPVTTTTSKTTTTTEATTTEAITEDLCSLESNDCPNNQFCAETNSGNRCECVPGTTLNGGNCESAKKFGGKLHIDIVFDPSLNDSSSDAYKAQEQVYINLLVIIYGGESWFVGVIILGFSSGSTVVNYELVTKDDDAVNSATIERSFSSFLTNPEYFESCTCEDTTCASASSNLGFSSPILANSSCNDAGTATDLICEDPVTSQYCDSASAICDALLDGDIICQCNSGYVDNPDSVNSCIQIICTKNSDCNSPFGECVNTTENDAGRCSCISGFIGNHCHASWWFILVVVLCGILFIGLVIVAVCVVKKKYRSSKWEKSGSYYEKVIRNNEAKTQGGQNVYEWENKPTGIVSKGFKRIGNNEPYDSFSYSNNYAIPQDNDHNNQEELVNPYDEAFQLQERGKRHGNSGANGVEEDVSWRVREQNNGAGVSEIDLSKYTHQVAEM